MQLRRFTAESTPAALSAVRVALGDDAIILANRKIGDQVEIIATGQMDDAQSLADISLDDDAEREAGESAVRRGDAGRANLFAVSNTQSNGIRTTPADVSVPAEISTRTPQGRRPEARDEYEPVAQQLTDEQLSSRRSAPGETPSKAFVKQLEDTQRPILTPSGHSVDVDTLRMEMQNLSDRLDGSSAERSAQLTAVLEQQNSDHLRSELASLSEKLHESIAKQSAQLAVIVEQQNAAMNKQFKGLEINLWGSNSPNKRMHLQRLFSLGIGAELAVQLVERADPQASVDDAMRHSFALLKSTLPIGSDKTFSTSGVTVLSGPPGSGKTTVLMKMATQHVKEHGSDSVVIICADTRRIGAFEELQAYGRLLGIPTVHAHDTSELDSLLGAFTHKQMVLVDHTLPMDDASIALPARLLQPENPDAVRRLFVISASMQSSSVDALVRTHCRKRSVQCVLTHLDANARLGELFSPIIRHHLPVAYWSDSASIQKPLQKAEASMLIATAAAMSRRLPATADDEWILRLIQPADNEQKKAPVRKTVDRELA